jgi:hypothetical protein
MVKTLEDIYIAITADTEKDSEEATFYWNKMFEFVEAIVPEAERTTASNEFYFDVASNTMRAFEIQGFRRGLALALQIKSDTAPELLSAIRKPKIRRHKRRRSLQIVVQNVVVQGVDAND